MLFSVAQVRALEGEFCSVHCGIFYYFFRPLLRFSFSLQSLRQSPVWIVLHAFAAPASVALHLYRVASGAVCGFSFQLARSPSTPARLRSRSGRLQDIEPGFGVCKRNGSPSAELDERRYKRALQICTRTSLPNSQRC